MHKKIFLLLFLTTFLSLTSYSSHLRAGEITAERISCSSLTFRITITVFLDTESGVIFGNELLEFGDGTSHFVKDQSTMPRPDLGPNMGMVIYSVEHTYSGYGTYNISYAESFRNKDIKNIHNSGTNDFFLETMIFLDPFLSCNQNLPDLLVPPIDKACIGAAFFHNPGAIDLDGDSLSYEMTTPKQAGDVIALNYRDPNTREFYINFQTGNEEKNGQPTFSINPLDGTIIWDAPGMVGEFNIAFRIIEWRKDPSGRWHKMSAITRDMQIVVEDCDNDRPDLIVPNDTCVTAGTILKKTIFGIDPNNDQVKIEVFSEVLNLFISPATYSPKPPKFQSSTPNAQLQFEWNTQCDHVKDQYYQVVFKITDNPPNGVKLVTFKTWRIKVVGPPPLWNNATLDLTKRSATLQWDNYVCEKANQMQVWRKIDGSDYAPANCETGMPGFLGYDLIETIQLRDPVTNEKVNRFTDTNRETGLAPGAVYCYRLVALFPDPKGGESYVSKDTCLAPILADAPVITHVSVEKTDASDGAIRISWYSPFEIDRNQFPGPYQYAVYRADGFEGSQPVQVTPVERIADTTFVDKHIDTHNDIYNYRIVLYANTATDLTTWIPVDTSATASSVRLEASSFPDRISLSWKAEVPWSNKSEKYPYHLIYRGGANDSQENFSLIDSVHVASNGTLYMDIGKYKNTPLNKDETYCYRIMTRGVYGNRAMKEPFKNFSQIICINPNEDARPCAPVLSLNTVNCDEIFASAQCMVKEFSNRLDWRSDCEEKVRSYRVYVAGGPDQEFILIAENVKDTHFIDKNLPSFARCYKIKSVDRQGVESEWSETVCNDNCPYFELPNIFTPNGDGCNEYFSAYGPFNPMKQDAPESCVFGSENYYKCIRFVENVSFRVFNRWGKEVYTYKSSGENSTYINWDGRDNDGRWLSSGVYYYLANVEFDALDESKKHQTLKGWIQLMR